MSRGLRPAVYRVMFRRGYHAEIFRILPLQACHKRYTHAAGQERIFAIRLLSTPPARIAEDVDIRRPEVEAFHDVAASSAHSLVVLRSGLSSNDDGHLMDGLVIKCGRQANGLGKYGSCTSIGNTMQGLAPPVISRYLQPGDSARLID